MKTLFSFLLCASVIAIGGRYEVSAQTPLQARFQVITRVGGILTSNADIRAATLIVRPEGGYAECEWHLSVQAARLETSSTFNLGELLLPLVLPENSSIVGATLDALVDDNRTGDVRLRASIVEKSEALTRYTLPFAQALVNAAATTPPNDAVLVHIDTSYTRSERYIVRVRGRFDDIRTVRIRFYAPLTWLNDEASVRLPLGHLQSSLPSAAAIPFTLVYGVESRVWRNARFVEVKNMAFTSTASVRGSISRDDSPTCVHWMTTGTVAAGNISNNGSSNISNNINARLQETVNPSLQAALQQNAILFSCQPALTSSASIGLPAYTSSKNQALSTMNRDGFFLRQYIKNGKGTYQAVFAPAKAWNLAPRQVSRAKLMLVYDFAPERAGASTPSPIEQLYNRLSQSMTDEDSIAVVLTTAKGIVKPYSSWQPASAGVLRNIREFLIAAQGEMQSNLSDAMIESVRFIEQNNRESASILLVSNANTLVGSSTTATIFTPALLLQQLRAIAPNLPNIHIADIQTRINAANQHLDAFYWTVLTNTGGSYGRLWSSNWYSFEALLGIQIPQILRIQNEIPETIEQLSFTSNVKNSLTFHRITSPNLAVGMQYPLQTVIRQYGRFDADLRGENGELLLQCEGRIGERLFVSRNTTSFQENSIQKGNQTDEEIWAIEYANFLREQSTTSVAAAAYLQHCLEYGIVSRATMLVFTTHSSSQARR